MTISPPYLPTKATYKPTHPDLFLIQFAEGDFNSCLITQKVIYVFFFMTFSLTGSSRNVKDSKVSGCRKLERVEADD